MSVRLKNSKNEKQMAVAKAVLELIEKDGLLGVTHSKVARKSKVSRAWIYEYIGKDKNAFIEFAAEAFASYVARLNIEMPKTKEQLQDRLKSGIRFFFESVAKDPVIIKVYFRFRGSANPIGDVIKKYEKKWFEMVINGINEFIALPAEQAAMLVETVLILRLGFAHRLATSETPEDTRKKAEDTFDQLHGLISNFI